MIHIFRRRSSSGARELAGALGGRRLRDERAVRRVSAGDLVVCWGDYVQHPQAGVTYLNNVSPSSKLTDAVRLKAAGVNTIEVSQTRPVQEVGPDPIFAAYLHATNIADEFASTNMGQASSTLGLRDLRTPVMLAVTHELIDAIEGFAQAQLADAPVADQSEWLPRLNNHVGGNDLLDIPDRPDFFVKKENLVREYRVHSFDGTSIRAGVKKIREGYGSVAGNDSPDAPNYAHPWIRSWDAGWRISYDGVTIQQAHRELANRAVRALDLTFGAVDIGETPEGRLIVLEVNRAPGLEGGTVTAYANAIQRWNEAE
jgi:hypothetical protein